MARINNELFHFLTSRNIFKNYFNSDRCSEKTEQRRIERNRGILVWLASGQRKDSITGMTKQIGRGTYIRSLHGRLKYSKT